MTMERPRPILSGNTLIPLSFVMSMIGGIVWLTNIHFTADAAAKEAMAAHSETESTRDLMADKLDKINARLSRMEGQLSIIFEATDAKPRRRN